MTLRDAIERFRRVYPHHGDKPAHGARVIRPRVGRGEVDQPQAFRRDSGQHLIGVGKIERRAGTEDELRGVHGLIIYDTTFFRYYNNIADLPLG